MQLSSSFSGVGQEPRGAGIFDYLPLAVIKWLVISLLAISIRLTLALLLDIIIEDKLFCFIRLRNKRMIPGSRVYEGKQTSLC